MTEEQQPEQSTSDLVAERRGKLERLREAGVEPFPHEFSGREDIAVAHLHINDADLLADPEIALPARGLQTLVDEGVVGGAVEEHVSVMGYQDRSLPAWREVTAPAIVAHLRAQHADGLVLAPA